MSADQSGNLLAIAHPYKEPHVAAQLRLQYGLSSYPTIALPADPYMSTRPMKSAPIHRIKYWNKC